MPMTSELLAYLESFIAFRTTADNPVEKEKCLTWIQEKFLEPIKNDIRKGEVDGAPYLYYAHPQAKLLWFAHIDVVPADDDFFSLTINEKEDKVYGRGVKDMKGAILPFLMAFSEMCADGIPPVGILLTSDEETAGKTIPKLLAQGFIKTPVAFTPDTGSNPCIVVEHKGVVWGELIAKGSGGHAAMPWEADNPIPRLANAIQKIHKKFPAGNVKDWHVTVSFGELCGSSARNQIPAVATASIDIRFPSEMCATPKKAVSLVEKELPEGCSIEVVLTADALRTDPDHPMIKNVQSIAQDITGESVEIGREHGATDARYFGSHGIPAFLYGPIGGNLHAPEEWVSMVSLNHQYEIGKRLLASLSS